MRGFFGSNRVVPVDQDTELNTEFDEVASFEEGKKPKGNNDGNPTQVVPDNGLYPNEFNESVGSEEVEKPKGNNETNPTQVVPGEYDAGSSSSLLNALGGVTPYKERSPNPKGDQIEVDVDPLGIIGENEEAKKSTNAEAKKSTNAEAEQSAVEMVDVGQVPTDSQNSETIQVGEQNDSTQTPVPEIGDKPVSTVVNDEYADETRPGKERVNNEQNNNSAVLSDSAQESFLETNQAPHQYQPTGSGFDDGANDEEKTGADENSGNEETSSVSNFSVFGDLEATEVDETIDPPVVGGFGDSSQTQEPSDEEKKRVYDSLFAVIQNKEVGNFEEIILNNKWLNLNRLVEVEESEATLLECAINSKNTKCVKILLKNGAEVKDGVLGLAAYLGAGEILEMLYENHQGNNSQDKSQEKFFNYKFSNGTANTPLASFVIKNNDPKYNYLVKKLIESGADVDLKDSEGRTALFYAAEHGKLDIVKILLSDGASFDIADINQITKSSDEALLSKQNKCVDLIKKYEEVKKFFEEDKKQKAKTSLFSFFGNNNPLQNLLKYESSESEALSLFLSGHNSDDNIRRFAKLLTEGLNVADTDLEGLGVLSFRLGKDKTEKLRDAFNEEAKKSGKLEWQEGQNLQDFYGEFVESLKKKTEAEKRVFGKTKLMMEIDDYYTFRGSKEKERKLKLVEEMAGEEYTDLNAKDNEGNTALDHAAKQGTEWAIIILRAMVKKIEDETDNEKKLQLINQQQNLLYNVIFYKEKELFDKIISSLNSIDGKGKVEPILNFKTKNNTTPLTKAVEMGNLEIVKALINAGADLDLKGSMGNAPLIIAVKEGKTEIAKALIAAKADVNKSNSDGFTPLMIAAVGGNTEIVQALLEKGASVNTEDWHHNTPLMLAAAGGNAEIVQALLAAKADVNKSNSNGFTPLMLAAEGGYTEIVQALLEKKAELDAKNNSGETPLMLAVKRGYTEIVQALLEKEVDLDAKNAFGSTPLIIAVEGGKTEIVQALLDAKASVDTEGWNRNTPLMVAAARGHKEIVQALIEKEANVNKSNSDGRTPLMFAAVKGDKNIVQALIKAEAKMDNEDLSGHTALFYAAENGKLDIVKILLSAGASFDIADINQITKSSDKNLLDKQNKCTDLIKKYAEVKEIEEIVRREGANLNAKDSLGRTAIDYATENNQKEVAKVILQAMVSKIESETDSAQKLKLIKEQNNLLHRQNNLLHIAIWTEEKELFNTLVKNLNSTNSKEEIKAILNSKNKFGFAPLTLAVMSGQKEAVQALINAGANVNIKSNRGSTPLMIAFKTRQTELAKTLIENGADVNIRDNRGEIALMAAASIGQKDIFEMILAKGANLNAKDRLGRTALHYAMANKQYDFGRAILNKMIQGFEDNKETLINPFQNENESTLLHAAAACGDAESLKFLIDKRIGVNIANKNGDTALHFAAQNGHLECVKMLIKNGASLNAENNYKNTPLNLAAFGQSKEIIKTLLEAGANPEIVNNAGYAISEHNLSSYKLGSLEEEIWKKMGVYNDKVTNDALFGDSEQKPVNQEVAAFIATYDKVRKLVCSESPDRSEYPEAVAKKRLEELLTVSSGEETESLRLVLSGHNSGENIKSLAKLLTYGQTLDNKYFDNLQKALDKDSTEKLRNAFNEEAKKSGKLEWQEGQSLKRFYAKFAENSKKRNKAEAGKESNKNSGSEVLMSKDEKLAYEALLAYFKNDSETSELNLQDLEGKNFSNDTVFIALAHLLENSPKVCEDARFAELIESKIKEEDNAPEQGAATNLLRKLLKSPISKEKVENFNPLVDFVVEKEGFKLAHVFSGGLKGELLKKVIDSSDAQQIKATNNLGKSPLRLAVEQNNQQVVDLLLAKGAQHHIKDGDGKSAFDVAALSKECSPDIFEKLTKTLPPVDFAAYEKSNFVHKPSISEEKRIFVKDNIAAAKAIKSALFYYDKPARKAIITGLPSTPSLVLEKILNSGNKSGVELAGILREDENCRRQFANLLSYEINLSDDRNLGILGNAISFLEKDVVKEIIDRAKFGMKDSSKTGNAFQKFVTQSESGLSRQDYIEMIYGVKNFKKDQRGVEFREFSRKNKSGLKFAEQNYKQNNLHIAASVDNKDFCEAVLNKDKYYDQEPLEAKLSQRDIYGNTPLMAAAFYGNIEVGRMIAKQEMNFGLQRDSQSKKVLAAALKGKNENQKAGFIKMLLQEGCVNSASINQASELDGSTALHFAAKTDNVELLKLLLEKGADINIKDKQGRKASDIAKTSAKEILTDCEAVTNELTGHSFFNYRSNDSLRKILQLDNAEVALKGILNGSGDKFDNYRKNFSNAILHSNDLEGHDSEKLILVMSNLSEKNPVNQLAMLKILDNAFASGKEKLQSEFSKGIAIKSPINLIKKSKVFADPETDSKDLKEQIKGIKTRINDFIVKAFFAESAPTVAQKDETVGKEGNKVVNSQNTSQPAAPTPTNQPAAPTVAQKDEAVGKEGNEAVDPQKTAQPDAPTPIKQPEVPTTTKVESTPTQKGANFRKLVNNASLVKSATKKLQESVEIGYNSDSNYTKEQIKSFALITLSKGAKEILGRETSYVVLKKFQADAILFAFANARFDTRDNPPNEEMKLLNKYLKEEALKREIYKRKNSKGFDKDPLDLSCFKEGIVREIIQGLPNEEVSAYEKKIKLAQEIRDISTGKNSDKTKLDELQQKFEESLLELPEMQSGFKGNVYDEKLNPDSNSSINDRSSKSPSAIFEPTFAQRFPILIESLKEAGEETIKKVEKLLEDEKSRGSNVDKLKVRRNSNRDVGGDTGNAL